MHIGISGDGNLTGASRQLFNNCDILIHDAYQLKDSSEGHATAVFLISFAHTLPHLKILALVHIHRKERQHNLQAFLELGKKCPFKVMIAKSKEVIQLIF